MKNCFRVNHAFRANLDEQIERLRTKWEQAHYVPPEDDSIHSPFLIILPGMTLPKGYDKTICTALFLAHMAGSGKTVLSPLNHFWIDLPEIGFNPPIYEGVDLHDGPEQILKVRPQSSHPCEKIPQVPNWKDLWLFRWGQVEHDPNRDSLYTQAMVIRKRVEQVI